MSSKCHAGVYTQLEFQVQAGGKKEGKREEKKEEKPKKIVLVETIISCLFTRKAYLLLQRNYRNYSAF